MPVVYDADGKLWDRFGVIGTPAYVLLDGNGLPVFRGWQHNDELEAALASISSNVPDELSGPLADGPENPGVVDIDGMPVELEPDGTSAVVAYRIATWCTSYVRESYPELSQRFLADKVLPGGDDIRETVMQLVPAAVTFPLVAATVIRVPNDAPDRCRGGPACL